MLVLLFSAQRIVMLEAVSVLKKSVARNLWAHMVVAIGPKIKKVALCEAIEDQDKIDTKSLLIGLAHKDHQFIKALTICLRQHHLSRVDKAPSSTLQTQGDQIEEWFQQKVD